jgi:gliding motility-associated lipoprotein GldH
MTLARKGKSSLFVATSFFAGGMCGPSPVFDSFQPLVMNGMQIAFLKFVVPIENVDDTYAVNVKMRHNANYPFANLYMFRKIKSNNGLEYQDTVNFIVADPRGKWLGKGVGEVKTMVWPYRANTIKFNTPGKYTFTLQQGMRQEALPWRNGYRPGGFCSY